MKYNTVKVLTAAAACMVLGFLVAGRPALADTPDTVSITFAMTVPCSPQDDDPAPVLSDFVGEDTVVVVIGASPEVADGLHFHVLSPDCDGVKVKDTSWWLHAHASIMNKGKPLSATVWTSGLLTPPEHYALVAEKITEVHACWLEYEGTGDVVAQDAWDWYTQAAFIIVTAEFRVTN